VAAEPTTSRRSASRRSDGARIETLARDFLQRQGLLPVAANAHYRGGELDLVMRDGDSLVFVEVRYRKSAAFGGAAASVDAGKRRKLVLAAELFLAAHRDLARLPCRFDVVAAHGDPEAPSFDWLRDAFRADDCG
jgi:putative endonuclease